MPLATLSSIIVILVPPVGAVNHPTKLYPLLVGVDKSS
jgi:hypothetical protein